MARHSAAERPTSPARDGRSAGRRPADDPCPTERIAPVAAEPPPSAGPAAATPAAPAAPRPSALRLFVGWLGSLALLAAVALAVAVAVVPAATGGSALTVLSPSMTPTFPVGTLVVIRPRPVDEIRIGDVVSFTDRDPATGATRTVTHRVIGVDPGPAFRTKGDANEAPDPDPVLATEVRGVEWYSIPKVGQWGSAARSGPGLLLSAGGVLVVVALMLLVPRRNR